MHYMPNLNVWPHCYECDMEKEWTILKLSRQCNCKWKYLQVNKTQQYGIVYEQTSIRVHSYIDNASVHLTRWTRFQSDRPFMHFEWFRWYIYI